MIFLYYFFFGGGADKIIMFMFVLGRVHEAQQNNIK